MGCSAPSPTRCAPTRPARGRSPPLTGRQQSANRDRTRVGARLLPERAPTTESIQLLKRFVSYPERASLPTIDARQSQTATGISASVALPRALATALRPSPRPPLAVAGSGSRRAVRRRLRAFHRTLGLHAPEPRDEPRLGCYSGQCLFWRGLGHPVGGSHCPGPCQTAPRHSAGGSLHRGGPTHQHQFQERIERSYGGADQRVACHARSVRSPRRRSRAPRGRGLGRGSWYAGLRGGRLGAAADSEDRCCAARAARCAGIRLSCEQDLG